jgi:pyruvate,water dikinase
MDNFMPEGCLTLHDIIRLVHEKAVAELFSADHSDETLLKNNMAVRLDTPLPSDIFIIDIGGGLHLQEEKSSVTLGEINCIPFKSLISGMMHPDLVGTEGPVGGKDSLTAPEASVMKYTGKNVAVISREYMNLSLRFGSHFNMIDSYCSDNVKDNHIYFRFVGGAADLSGRSRRAELLTDILKECDMEVNKRGEIIIARTGNITRPEAEEILNAIGRMIIFTRRLDLLMDDDRTIEHYFNTFRKMFS